MAKLVPLFSSSKGNCFYLQGNDDAILIDAGKNCKQIELAMMSNNISMDNVKAVFITHEHIDHCSALRVLVKRYKIPVYATTLTMEELLFSQRVTDDMDLHTFDYDEEIKVGGFKLIPVKTSHDAAQSCGYYIETPDNRKMAIVTDTGIFKDDARKKVCGCDLLVIESNHDIKMLDEGMYPYLLKRRIKGASGHLSNLDCAKELPAFVESGVKHILLAHLSEENNTLEKAENTSEQELVNAGYERDVDYILEALPPQTNGRSVSF